MLVIILFYLLLSAETLSVAATKPKWEGTVWSEIINGTTALQVWPLFEDFCNIYKFFPVDVSFCTELVTKRPGLSRTMATEIPSPPGSGGGGGGNNTAATMIQWERHELLAVDPKARSVRYRMRENNQGIKTYVPTMTVLAKDDDGCQVKWHFVADPVDGLTIDDFRAALQSILASAVDNIKQMFESTTTT